MRKRDNEKKNINVYIKLIPLILASIVLILTIGYSIAADNLGVDASKAIVRADANIRLTSVRLWETINGGAASNVEFSIKHLTSDIVLPNSNSTVNFLVSVTNAGNVEMGLTEILGLPSNLEYTIDGYVLESTLCDDNNHSMCTLGSVTTFNVIVGYKENGFNSADTTYSIDMGFDFKEMIYTARIGSDYYLTIQDAIDAAPTDHTETTIVLLRNTYQRIKIWSGNNIVLDMPNLVLHNKEFAAGTVGDPVVEILGTKDKNERTVAGGTATFKMVNGTMHTEASQSAVNVEDGGNFIMTGGTIVSVSERQALYVHGGTAEISGTAVLRAQAVEKTNENNYRATVHVKSGSLVIKGGTIESVGGSGIALTNEDVMTIGVKDGNISTTSPVIKANNIGLHIKTGSTVNYYDGIIKSKNILIREENMVTDVETGYEIVHSSETIGSDNYYTAFLGIGYMVTFDPDGGNVSELSRKVPAGQAIGLLPTPTNSGYDFKGWYTLDGTLVESNYVVNADTDLIAHWDVASVARIGDTNYTSLASAISAATANTPTTIKLIRDVTEKVTINSNKNIILDIEPYTLSNPDGSPVITNKGTLTIASGTFLTRSNASNATVITNTKTLTMTGGELKTSSTSTAALNNNGSGATFTMTGGSITATGLRQAIYNDGGSVSISGTSYLTSSAKVESTNARGTVQNLAAGTLEITGGTIVSVATNGIGVTNLGTATIGVKDGVISTTSPIIQGVGRGVNNTGTLNFYDGIFRGQSSPMSGNIADSDGTYTTGSEVVDMVTYQTGYLSQ